MKKFTSSENLLFEHVLQLMLWANCQNGYNLRHSIWNIPYCLSLLYLHREIFWTVGYLIFSLFWNFIQGRLIVLYRRFGTDTLPQNVCNTLPIYIPEEARYRWQFECCLTVDLGHEIMWNANLMQLGYFIDVSLARNNPHNKHDVRSGSQDHLTYLLHGAESFLRS